MSHSGITGSLPAWAIEVADQRPDWVANNNAATSRYPAELTDDYEFDFLVFIGRFQPFHIGHQRVIDEALRRAHRVIVLIGSDGAAPSMRNPWSFRQRESMILEHYRLTHPNRLATVGVQDHLYNETAWIREVQGRVNAHRMVYGKGDGTVGLIGLKKDNSSDYLDMFPQWRGVNVEQTVVYSATAIRQAYYGETPYISTAILPASTSEFLDGHLHSSSFNNIWGEARFQEDHKKLWAGSPFPPTFNTVDAVVTRSGFILLVRRGDFPGKGLLALPGGYLDVTETLETSMLRELHEETDLDLATLEQWITARKTFDDPYRCEYGRIITEAFLIELPSGHLPAVQGGDDAEEAMWVPLTEVRSDEMFSDHYHIINNMVGLD